MYGISKTTVCPEYGTDRADTTPDGRDPCPTDPWLFTDPFARDLYVQRGQIDQLEEDIQTYVMFNGCWAPEEVEYKLEIRRLLREALIAPRDSFGYLSPHPTVYRALREGTLVVSGQRHAFKGGEGIIFEPWLARYAQPGLIGPLRVGQLYHVSSPCLCCDAFPNICVPCEKTLAIMRQILNYRNNGKGISLLSIRGEYPLSPD